MTRFVTVTLNPAIDKTLGIDRLLPGAVHRARILSIEAGGKGIIVALTLRALGAQSVVAGGLLGREGAAYALTQLDAASVAAEFIPVAGAVRINITLIETATGETTKINEPGLTASHTDLDALLAWADDARPGDYWALCGSLPPGLPDTTYSQMIHRLKARGALTFLDSSGLPLRYGLEAQPFAVKINREEAAFVLDETLPGRVSLLDETAARLRARCDIPLCAITYGPLGIALQGRDDGWCARSPTITARNTVGAGDAALAGMMDAVARAQSDADIVRWMTACGSAAAAHPRSSMNDDQQVRRLFEQIEARPVSS